MSNFENPADSSPAEVAAYVTAIFELLGDADPIEVLEELPHFLGRTLERLGDERARKPESPGKWSVAEVTQHLADSELVWAYRLRMVLAHDRPSLEGYDQDLWATQLDYTNAPLDEALDRIRVMRNSNLRLIRGLNADQRARVSVHSERGDETVEHMIGLYAGHDLVHRAQIERISKAVE